MNWMDSQKKNQKIKNILKYKESWDNYEQLGVNTLNNLRKNEYAFRNMQPTQIESGRNRQYEQTKNK